MRNFLQHYLNPVHIMCFLCKCGCDKKLAKRIAEKYEIFYKWSFLGE